MAKIPVYEQGQLASSIVGTPGVDTSAAQLMNVVGNSWDNIAGALGQNIQANNIELVRRQKEQEQLAREQKKILDSIDEAHHAGNVDQIQMQELDKAKAETQGDPAYAAPMFRDRSTSALDEYLNTIQDPEMRNRVRLAGIKSMNEKAHEISGWAMTQRTQNAKAKVETTIAGYANLAGKFSTAKQVGETWQKIEAMRGEISLTFGADADKVIQQGKRAVALQFIEGQIVNDPALAETQVRSGAFDSVLNASDKDNLIYRAHGLTQAAERQQKTEYNDAALGERITFAIDDANTDHTDPVQRTQQLDKITKAIHEQSTKPKEQQNLPLINDLAEAKKRLEKIAEMEKADKLKQYTDNYNLRYNSTRAGESRAWLDGQQKDFAKQVKDKTLSADAALAKLDKLKNQLGVYKKAGYLDPYGKGSYEGRYLQWINAQRNSIMNRPKNHIEQFFADHGGVGHEVRQMAKQVPPPPGKNAAKTADAMSVTAQEIFHTNVERYTKMNGVAPSPALQKVMKANAINQAAGKHYGH